MGRVGFGRLIMSVGRVSESGSVSDSDKQPGYSKLSCVEINIQMELCSVRNKLERVLQTILRQSYDYLTMMPKLRSIYDGCLIYKTCDKERN